MHTVPRLLLDSLETRFFSIQAYSLDYTWHIDGMTLNHTVLWHVREGDFQFSVDGRRYAASPGDIIILPPDARLTSRALSARIRLASLNFDMHVTFLKSRVWTELLGIPVKYPGVTSEMVLLIDEMIQLNPSGTAGKNLLLQGNLLKLIGLVFNGWFQGSRDGLVEPPPEESLRTMDRRIGVIGEYLTAHPDQMPDLKQLSALVDVSESYLRKIFVHHTGLSPLQYVHYIKLDQSKQRLAMTEDRISDIAYALGFQDPNYFSRLFKKKTGYSPQEYRRKNRGI